MHERTNKCRVVYVTLARARTLPLHVYMLDAIINFLCQEIFSFATFSAFRRLPLIPLPHSLCPTPFDPDKFLFGSFLRARVRSGFVFFFSLVHLVVCLFVSLVFNVFA